MKLGAHLSISGGINQALESAKKIKANTLQIFSSPPKNWQKPNISKSTSRKFINLARKYQISPIFIHAKYLVNLGSQNPQTVKKSIKALVDDLKLADKIKAKGVIFHPRIKNFPLLIKSIKRVLAASPQAIFLILENSAQIKLEDMGKIIKKVKSKRIKFCFDISHAYQAGYDLTKINEFRKVLKTIKKEIGLKRWLVIHANDSKTTCGSKHDQHENIGQGKLGEKPFVFFLKHPFTSKLPFILETPGFKEKGLQADKKNLKILKKLALSFFEK